MSNTRGLNIYPAYYSSLHHHKKNFNEQHFRQKVFVMMQTWEVWSLYFNFITYSSPSCFKILNICIWSIGWCIMYHISVFVSSARPRGAPPEWGVLGSCEPYWSPGLLRWGKACCWDDVLCLHETGRSEIEGEKIISDLFSMTKKRRWRDDTKVIKQCLWLYQHAKPLMKKDKAEMYLKK